MRRSAAHTVLVLVLCSAAWGAEGPVAVSPGSATGSVISDACPTFSWGAVAAAKFYELVVYRVEEGSEEATPVLRQRISGSALSWTPSLDSCLERGGQYAWSVRAEGRKGSSEWSAPSLFEVAVGPSVAEFEEALQVVLQYLEEEATGSGDLSSQGVGPSAGAISATVVGPSARRSTADPAPLSVVAGDSALQVNGSAVVTVATLAGALCSATEVRFLDQGDGTVLDCNTGKIWLKDASCVGEGPWDGTIPFDSGSAQARVADLNSGMDFNCSDYTAGTYTDWEIPAMTDLCGLWSGSCSGPSCCTASMGIVDTSFSNPTVANARDDGQWIAEDAFVGVLPSDHWSAAELDANNAWFVFLFNGEVGTSTKTDFDRVWPVRGGQ